MQVDVRTADALGMAVRCVLTASTAQSDAGVTSVAPVPEDNIAASIEAAVTDDPGIGAVKIGMLFNRETINTVSEGILSTARAGTPVVLDPVMRSTAGSMLIQEGGAKYLLDDLLEYVTLITPNLAELEILSQTAASIEDKVHNLLDKGPLAVLVTDGEGSGDQCEDTLYHGSDKDVFRHQRLPGQVPRGTGCALSTAIAVNLARGVPLRDAVRTGIDFTFSLIENSSMVGNQRLLFPTRGWK